MLSQTKKDANKRKQKVALAAYERWMARAEVRKNPQVLKDKDPDEFKKETLRQDNYLLREQNRPPVAADATKRIVIPERIIRVNDLKDFPPNELAQKAGIPVARLQNIVPAGIEAEGFATGFLIAPDLLMTNHHVFPDINSAKQCAADFQYERTLSGVQNGFVFEINPGKFYLSDEELDYAIVFIEPQSITGNITLRNFNSLPLIGTKGKVIKGSQVNIIQYPSGGYKKYAYEDNIVLDIIEDPGFIQYTTDTQPGSSGSPAFNKSYELAALHHSGVPMVVKGKIMDITGKPWDPENQEDDEIQWMANEGISISSIIAQLKEKRMPTNDQQEMLDSLLNSVSDPVLNGTTPIENVQPVDQNSVTT
ncbi:MAG: serine protease, partial [Bacteroidota bacterium]